MRRLFTIVVLTLGALLLGGTEIVPSESHRECNLLDLHHEQLVCNNRCNINIEPPYSTIVPSAQSSTTTNISRQAQQRVLYMSAVASIRVATNYPIVHYILHSGSFSRAVDFYLYTLCQLRL